jgi:predicted nucleic acid-binding protein
VKRLIVDTSVVSYLFKKHSLAPHYWEILRGNFLGVSFMTAAELYRWPLGRNWSERRVASLHLHLRSYTVLPYDDAMSWEWARIKCRRGRPIADADAWIAATAVRHGAPLVTHNPRHFLHVERLALVTVPAQEDPEP